MLSKLKISSRVLVLGVVPLLILIMVLIGAFWTAQVKDRLFNRLYDQHLAILSDVMSVQQILQQSVLQDIRKYRTGWASASATEQSVKDQLAQAELQWQHFVASRPQLVESAEQYTALDQAFGKAIKHYQEWISYAGTDALLVRILNESTVNNEIELRITAFAALTEQFIQQQIAAGGSVRDEAEHFTRQLVQVYSIGGLVIVGLIVLLIWLIQRSVCHPLWALRDMLQRIEKESDLSLRASVSGDDEVAQAASAFNGMIGHFEQLVAKLAVSAGALSQQATQVYNVSDEVSLSTLRQAQQASQLASAAEQMSVSVDDVAVNARNAMDAAQHADTMCDTGVGIARESANGITALAAQLNDSANVVALLQQESGHISGVLDVIRKISDQTNLLALNAAIEAARAGEAGRGFSVVADEVRTLSANTKQATESIHLMINKLQQQASGAVQSMQKAHLHADENVRLAQQTGERFTELAMSIEHIAQANKLICEATGQQQQVSVSIADSIHALNGDIAQLSDEAGRSAQASEQLNRLASQLNADWQVFHITGAEHTTA